MSESVWCNTCRLCLESKTKFIDASANEELSEYVYSLLWELFEVVILLEEDLPREICCDCWDTVSPMYEFRKQVMENQKLLFKKDTQDSLGDPVQDEIIDVLKEESNVKESYAQICDEVSVNDIIVEEAEESWIEHEEKIDYDQETLEISLLDERKEEKPMKGRKLSQIACVITENFPEFEKITCPLGSMTWAEKDEMVRTYISLKCTECEDEQDFQTFEALQKHHIAKGHPGKMYVICCKKEFSDRKLLYQHLVLHQYPDTYACFECKKPMRSKDYLKKHLFSHLPYELRPIECEQCGKKFLGNNQLKHHMISHDPQQQKPKPKPKKVRENVWEKVEEEVLLSTTMDDTDRELRKYDKDRAIYEHFPGFELLTNPQNYIAPEEKDGLIRQFVTLDCKECPEKPTFHTFEELVDHYDQQHRRSQAIVHCCGKEFYKKERLMCHIAIHLNPNAFACPVCQKQSQTKDLLKKHLYTHLPRDARPLECAQCDKKFCHKAQLRFHMASHVEPEGRKFVCDECGKGFAYQFVLDRHVKAHKRVADYVCEVCAKAFTGRSNYLDHKMRHHDIPDPVICPICGNKYRNSISLRSHMALHTDRREHKCDQCQKVFTARAGLLAHIRYVHSDKWLYKCHICKKKIRTRIELKDHVARHTGTTTYQCEFCSKTFTSRSYYFSHRKKSHPLEHAKLPKKQKFFVQEN